MDTGGRAEIRFGPGFFVPPGGVVADVREGRRRLRVRLEQVNLPGGYDIKKTGCGKEIL